MKNLITKGLPSKGRLKDRSISFFGKRGLQILVGKLSIILELYLKYFQEQKKLQEAVVIMIYSKA